MAENGSQNESITWPNDLYEFAKQVVWFSSTEQDVTDLYAFLAFIMARAPFSAYEHARRVFGFTDEDFIEALRQAKAGIFMYPANWEEWNKRFGVDFPMPKKKWFSNMSDEELEIYFAPKYSGAEWLKDNQEKIARAKNVREAQASNALEGYRCSEFALELSEKYILGEITIAENIALLRAHYGLENIQEAQEQDEEPRKRRKRRKELDEMENQRQGHEWQVRLNRQKEQQRAEAEKEKEARPLDVASWRELMEAGRAKRADTGHDERQEGEREL